MKKRSTTYRLNKVDYAIFIIFSIAAAVMLFLFYRDLNSFTITQSEEPVAKIYFKQNTAQRKFIDNDIWEVLTDSSDIYDGDRIRTSKNSEAYTEFLDSGVQIQLREKSMVQIFKNKKERSIDFIGGEIFVANNSPEEKIVIHSGKKEISISQASEVKLALPEVSEAVAAGAEEAVEEDNTVVIEVVSGQVEVTEQPVEKNEKRESREAREVQEAAPIVVSAGEKITLVPTVVQMAKAKAAVAAEIAAEREEVSESAPEPAEESVEEVAVETIAKVTPVPAPVAKPAPAPAPVKVKTGLQNQINRSYAIFQKSIYDPENHKYNYSTGFNLYEISAVNTTIPAGAVLQLTMRGTSYDDLGRITIQISTGEEPWLQAHDFKWSIPNKGRGIIKDEPFEFTETLVVKHSIVNTDSSWVNICYDPEILDQPITMQDLEVSLKVVSDSGGLTIKPVEKGYIKTIAFSSLTPSKEYWGSGKEDYDYRFVIDTQDIFGPLVSLTEGRQVLISISGMCDKKILWFHPEIIDNTDDRWDQVFLDSNEGDYYSLRFTEGETAARKQFHYEKKYDILRPLNNSSMGQFLLIADHEGMASEPTFTDLQIVFEVY